MLFRDIIELKTETNNFYNITDDVSGVLKKSKIRDGLCNIFVSATTAGMLINEDDRMLIEDFKRLLNSLAPETRLYQHPENAQSHLKASMMSQNITVPVADGRLALGTWQNILLWEFDTKPRERKIIVTVIY